MTLQEKSAQNTSKSNFIFKEKLLLLCDGSESKCELFGIDFMQLWLFQAKN